MDSSNNIFNKQINVHELLDTFNIKNKTNFPLYVKSIWKDLSRRSEKCEKGFDKVIFSNYYYLPGLISTRLFNLLDKDKDGYLSYSEFSKGMMLIFNSSFDELIQFIFNFFDENKDGYVTAEDVRTIFQYIPLQKSKFAENSFKDRLESQEELHDIITSFFKNKEKLDFNTFKNLTEKENSTIFLYITVYLLTNKPFSDKTLTFYQKDTSSSNNHPNVDMSENYNSFNENKSGLQKVNTMDSKERKPSLIASPNLTSKFSPSIKILKSPIMKEERHRIRQELMDKSCMYKKVKTSGSFNKLDEDSRYYSVKSSDYAKLNSSEINEDLKSLNLLHPSRLNWKVNNKEDEDNNYVLNEDNANLLDALESNIEGKDEAEDTIYEGYLIKLVENKLKKLWFTLYEKYLYYYKHKTDTIHKGMHSLTDSYVKACGKVSMMGTYLFRFEIYFQNKVREYYVQNEEEYKNWIEKLNNATGYSSISAKYEIVDKLSSGKFGVIKQVINKETKEISCLKIMNKKTMSNKDLQELKTEVEIMKICQHPNIVRLYDIFENQDCKYLVMEYCEDGDLFKYLENKNFKLSEKEVISILKQILAGVFYLQQYGITHRDLKPENILVKKEKGKYIFKIADFGLSKIISPEEKCEEPYGTLCYCSPEVVAHKPYNKQVDLWSIGIITYLMLIGCLPFNVNSKESDIIHQILNEPTPYPINQWRKISYLGKSFVMGLLQKDPYKRMTIKQALEHEWLTDKNNSSYSLNKNKSKSLFAEYCNADEYI